MSANTRSVRGRVTDNEAFGKADQARRGSSARAPPPLPKWVGRTTLNIL